MSYWTIIYVLHLDFALYKDLQRKSFPSLQFYSHYKKSRDFEINTQKRKILKQIIQIRQEQARIDESFCANDILDFMMSTNSNNDNRKVVMGLQANWTFKILLQMQDLIFYGLFNYGFTFDMDNVASIQIPCMTRTCSNRNMGGLWFQQWHGCYKTQPNENCEYLFL